MLASLPLASALPVGGRSGLTAIVALTTLTVRPQRTIIHLLSTFAVRPQRTIIHLLSTLAVLPQHTVIHLLSTLAVLPQHTVIHLLSTLAVRPQHNCHTPVINARRPSSTQLSYICYQHSPSFLNTIIVYLLSTLAVCPQHCIRTCYKYSQSVVNTVSYSCYEHFPSVLNTILLLYFFFLSTLHVCPPLTPYYAPIFVQHSPITFYSDLFQCSRRRPRLSKKCNRPGSESADKWTSRRVKGRLFERCD